MSGFLNDDLRQRVNRLRDELSRGNTAIELRLRQMEADNLHLRDRLSVLTRLLISKQIVTAEEIATALTELSRPPSPPDPPADAASTVTDGS